MLKYNANLKDKARQLRKNLTDSEKALWSRLRNKQLLGVQFYRQKPIGEHIVDFFAPGTKLVVEVDGSQHMGGDHVQKDRSRDGYLASLGLKVLRFNSREPDFTLVFIHYVCQGVNRSHFKWLLK